MTIVEVCTDAFLEDHYEWKDGRYDHFHHDEVIHGDHYFVCGDCERRLTEAEQDRVRLHL